MTSRLIAGLARMITGAAVFWTGCQPDPKQRIYFANHTSNFDALAIWAVLPPDVRALTRPVAARDYWTASKLRLYLATKVFNAVLIERKKVTAHDNPIEAMLQAIGASFSLIIFPEGGRNPGPAPGPFKSGLYHLARKLPQIELVPVQIENLNRILPKGEVLPVPLLSRITFGAPLRLEEAEDKISFLARARTAVDQLRQG